MFTRYQKSLVSAHSRILFAILIVMMLVLNPDGTIPSQASDITLLVDTLIDSNDPAYQVCSASPGDCSLRGAISAANADFTNRYMINIPGGTYLLSLPGASEDDNNGGDLDIKADLTLTGIEDGVTIMGNQVDRVLHVLPSADVLIDNIHISGGRSPDGVGAGEEGEPGGGIYNQGSLTLKNCTIEDNEAGIGGYANLYTWTVAGDGGSGGGIQNEGYLTLENSLISDNSAGKGGTGVYFSYCYEPPCCWECRDGGDGGEGGGVYNAGGLIILNSIIENNTAGFGGDFDMWGCNPYYGGGCGVRGQPGSGGGISNQASIRLVGSTLQGNQGGLRGGGLSNQGFAYLFDDLISQNETKEGGGLSNENHMEIEESQVINNTSDEGGGIHNEGELQMLYSTVDGNNAFLGGGVYNEGEAFLTGVLIQDNWTRDGPDGEDEFECDRQEYCPPTNGSSPPGGGIYNAGNMQLDQGIVSGNATGDGGKGGDAYGNTGEPGGNGGNGGFGGGIYNGYMGIITLNLTPVINNTTGDGGEGGTSPLGDGSDGIGGYGGGIFNSGVMRVMLGDVTGNQTGTGGGGDGSGGGIYNEGEGDLTYSFGTIADNQTSAVGDGGGVFSIGHSPIRITSSKVVNNVAGGRGGGLYVGWGSLYSASSLYAHNSIGSAYQGSGLYIHDTDARLLHTTLAQNSGGDGSGIAVVEASLQMTNTILVSHTIGISVALGAGAILENTLWGDGIWANQSDWEGSGSIITGTQNYWLEPGFLDPSNLDYHISSTSAAIDRGTPTEIEIDMDNQPRPNPAAGIVDLGADEYWEFIPAAGVDITGPMTGTTCTTITFTAVITPEEATPNILYYWVPAPESGQWTNEVRYQWTRPGIEIIEVTAINAGSVATDSFTISLEAGTPRLYLPLAFR